MNRQRKIWMVAGLALLAASCGKTASEATKETPTEKKSAYRVYVTNETTGDLTVIDSATMDVVANVHLGKRPRGIRASPDHKSIYVALSGSPIGGPGVDEDTLPPPDKSADGIGIFDVEQNKVVRVIEGGSDPESFDVSQDGKTLFVSNEDASGVSVLDIAAGKLTQVIKTGEEPEGVRLSPDGKLIYSTCEGDGTIAVIDVATKKLLKTFKVGRRPRTIAFMPDGLHAYVNAENDGAVVYVDAVKHEKMQAIPLGEPGVIKPMMALLSRDGSKLYVSTGRGKKVFVLDTLSNTVTASFEVGQRPWGMDLSPDGKTLFTANGPSKDVSVVDLVSGQVTKKITTPGSPWGVLVLAR